MSNTTVPAPDEPPAVPPGAPDWVTPELIRDTIRLWERRYAGRFTPDDALSILITVGELHAAAA